MKFIANIKSVAANRNLVALLTTAFFSLSGMTVQRMAVAWTIYDKTNDIKNLSMSFFFMYLPEMIVGPFIGVYMERANRKKIACKIQIYQAIVNFLFLISVSFFDMNVDNIYYVFYPILFIHGILNSAFVPTKNTLVTICAEKELLASALSMHSMMNNLSRLAGPALAVLIHNYFGLEGCIAFNTCCHLLVATGIYSVKIIRHVTPKTGATFLGMWKEVFVYYKIQKSLVMLLLSSYVLGMVVNAHNSFIPVIAKEILKGNFDVSGTLHQVFAVGGILAGVTMIAFSSYKKFPEYIALAMFVAGGAILGIGVEANLAIIIPLIFMMSFSFTLLKNMNRVTQLQAAPDELKARIVTLEWLLTSSFTGPSNLIVGAIIAYFGAVYSFLVLGLTIVGMSIFIRSCYIMNEKNNSKFLV